MKTSKISLLIIAVMLLLPVVTHAEFIINDKDGWTNLRKEPNAKSNIVGKIHKHQVFFETIDCGGDNATTGNWQAVDVKGVGSGYIFKNNITDIRSFPMIVSGKEDNYKDDGKSNVITAKKDNITVTMKIIDKKLGPSHFDRGAEEIILINGGKKLVIEPVISGARSFRLFAGNDGALYLRISSWNSDGEYQHGVYSIVNGEVVFSAMWYTGC